VRDNFTYHEKRRPEEARISSFTSLLIQGDFGALKTRAN
jgi:hypothetical protein